MSADYSTKAVGRVCPTVDPSNGPKSMRPSMVMSPTSRWTLACESLERPLLVAVDVVGHDLPGAGAVACLYSFEDLMVFVERHVAVGAVVLENDVDEPLELIPDVP